MTEQQIEEQLEALDSVTKKLMKSKKAAINFLLAAGIIEEQVAVDLREKWKVQQPTQILSEPDTKYTPSVTLGTVLKKTS